MIFWFFNNLEKRTKPKGGSVNHNAELIIGYEALVFVHKNIEF